MGYRKSAAGDRRDHRVHVGSIAYQTQQPPEGAASQRDSTLARDTALISARLRPEHSRAPPPPEALRGDFRGPRYSGGAL
jgi:hypothetical protein